MDHAKKGTNFESKLVVETITDANYQPIFIKNAPGLGDRMMGSILGALGVWMMFLAAVEV